MDIVSLVDKATRVNLCLCFLVSALAQLKVGLSAEEIDGLAFLLAELQSQVQDIKTTLEVAS
jgi:hypothetical protein